jgi:hypothetical protein
MWYRYIQRKIISFCIINIAEMLVGDLAVQRQCALLGSPCGISDVHKMAQRHVFL